MKPTKQFQNTAKEVFTIYKQMLSEYERLGEKIALLQSQLQNLPEGKLFSIISNIIVHIRKKHLSFYQKILDTKNFWHPILNPVLRI